MKHMGAVLSCIVQQHTNAIALHSQDAEILDYYFDDPESARLAARSRELAVEADARAELAKAYFARASA